MAHSGLGELEYRQPPTPMGEPQTPWRRSALIAIWVCTTVAVAFQVRSTRWNQWARGEARGFSIFDWAPDSQRDYRAASLRRGAWERALVAVIAASLGLALSTALAVPAFRRRGRVRPLVLI